MPSTEDLFSSATKSEHRVVVSSQAQNGMAASRVDVFFYSYYMDASFLAERGVVARNMRPAHLRGWRLNLNGDSTLVRDHRCNAWGVVCSLQHEELDRLYGWPGVARYRPYPVNVLLMREKKRIPVLCFLLEGSPGAKRPNPVYVEKLIQVMREHCLPVNEIELALMSPDIEAGLSTELAWLKSEFLKQNLQHEICQCGTARAVSRASHPDRFIAVFAAAVFLDQLVSTHFYDSHAMFISNFPVPSLVAHGTGGRAHPFWLFSSCGHGLSEIDIAWISGRLEELFGEGLRELTKSGRISLEQAIQAMSSELAGSLISTGMFFDLQRIRKIAEQSEGGGD